ncbi:uncharacterized protein N7511_006007 [Penicillium nucicola]|uniref:uncharacterized protein n=1 Tax=Penicillium nucicola TaxID=1850975 RepID=UPI00254587B9|nr:uncharacterized protein N7511_006007 [Penicillium nucicola]KAJ5757313.1 hypothetical protein N7511_006007 [Penicillium nucicola]
MGKHLVNLIESGIGLASDVISARKNSPKYPSHSYNATKNATENSTSRDLNMDQSNGLVFTTENRTAAPVTPIAAGYTELPVPTGQESSREYAERVMGDETHSYRDADLHGLREESQNRTTDNVFSASAKELYADTPIGQNCDVHSESQYPVDRKDENNQVEATCETHETAYHDLPPTYEEVEFSREFTYPNDSPRYLQTSIDVPRVTPLVSPEAYQEQARTGSAWAIPQSTQTDGVSSYQIQSHRCYSKKLVSRLTAGKLGNKAGLIERVAASIQNSENINLAAMPGTNRGVLRNKTGLIERVAASIQNSENINMAAMPGINRGVSGSKTSLVLRAAAYVQESQSAKRRCRCRS